MQKRQQLHKRILKNIESFPFPSKKKMREDNNEIKNERVPGIAGHFVTLLGLARQVRLRRAASFPWSFYF